MMALSLFKGVFYYEFRMQIQRCTVWFTPVVVLLGQLMLWGSWPVVEPLESSGASIRQIFLFSAVLAGYANLFLPLGIGVVMADRLSRDRHFHVEELVLALPVPAGIRVLGKYMGSLCATLLPVLLCYGIGICYMLWRTQNVLILPFSLITFAVIMLPGVLFVSTFSLACPAILSTPLYQFLFVCYWFWGNFLRPGYGIPTLSTTILTPSGSTIMQGLFGYNETRMYINYATTTQEAVTSILLLVGIALTMLGVLWMYLRWQQRH